MEIPLAERIRPKSIDDYIGQSDLMGKNGVIRKVIQSDNIPSMIFWGPPGVGKTSLANVISNSLKRPFYSLSAINAGVKDVREIISKASSAGLFAGRKSPILFIDEIHRFSKSQQDSLLGAVEKGIITLIGATTENPSFEVISALLSRCQVYVLKAHGVDELNSFLTKAVSEDVILKSKQIKLKETSALIQLSGGDARSLLNNFELIVNASSSDKIVIDNKAVKEIVKTNPMMFDKSGEQHYDVASALIKSIRGSDANAAIYYLALMVSGGEDPKFIARRLLISASEDIGLANPTALVMANSCFQAVEKLGYPECRIILSQTVIYLATSAKSNSAYLAINKAMAHIKNTGPQPIPLHLRNAPSDLMKNLDYGKDYKYAHDFPGNFVNQEFMPDQLKGQSFFQPSENSREQEIKQKLQSWWGSKYQ
ncbi:MAG: putative ATPase [Glaciecola sp.]|jgi:putative ATPase